MAHPAHIKARAISMLLLGHSVTQVAQSLGVPKATISRWKSEQAEPLMRQIVRESPRLREVVRQIREVLPGLARANGTKKREI